MHAGEGKEMEVEFMKTNLLPQTAGTENKQEA
jgi:hypothetical protein